jgi:hypothetical protein
MLAVVAALPQLAAAANTPPPAHPKRAAAASTPYAQYGALQEVYSFCAKAVPTQASYFQKQANALPAVQHNSEYVRGQHVLTQSLQQLPSSEAADACRSIGLTAGQTSKNPKPPARPTHRG